MKFFVLFFLLPILLSGLDHSGSITSDEWWDNVHTHYITGNVTVQNGVTLTIEAGSTIRFYEDCYLKVNGTLVADGTFSQNITFTSRMGGEYPGYWQKIEFSWADQGCVMNYCDVYYGGSVDGNIYCVNSSNNVLITHCDIQYSGTNGISLSDNNSGLISNTTISNNTDHGIYCKYVDALPDISNCQINNNGDHGIYASSGANPTINACTIQNNGSYAIRTYGDYVKNIGGSMTISGNAENAIYVVSDHIDDGTWNYHGVPYVIGGDLYVDYGSEWILAAGNTLKFDGNYQIVVYGRILANGTSNQCITFTSNQQTPAPGDWEKIYFNNSDNGSNFQYCDFQYGGSENNRGMLCFYDMDDHVNFTNCNIEYSADHGVFLWVYSSPSFVNCVIRNNDRYGVRCYANTNNPTFGSNLTEWNDIYNNNGHGEGRSYRNSNTNNTAEYVYWGTTDEAQIDYLIYDSGESSSCGPVDHTPWTNAAHDLEYPVQNLDPPQNMIVNIDTDNVQLTWDPVPGATSYKVFSSNLPDDGFSEDTNGVFTDTSWLAPASAQKKFYYVKAYSATE